jgi:hypothetical protein
MSLDECHERGAVDPATGNDGDKSRGGRASRPNSLQLFPPTGNKCNKFEVVVPRGSNSLQ